ncbi:ammonium transporter AmtB-like domain-containing protein [Hyaloscypha sp. PMI_1271]|nr:ammonium transporter AmtB-like domain-containing protein [Hyaloscypha sp. PMI_1271]
MMASGALVMLMIPAVCLFNSGASDRYSALIMFRLPFITTAFIGVQWYLWGYSLAFSPAVSPASSPWSWYGGSSKANALQDTVARPVGAAGAKIPELAFVFHHCMFASFTAALVCGGALRKVSVGRFLIFITIWSILVYDVVARWSWHPDGWSKKLGSMDFAGGTAVHITSGTTVAAISAFYAFETRGFLSFEDDAPHNINNVVLGTALLWIGWFGFNGGSALGGNLRAVLAITSTHIAACSGGSANILLFWLFNNLAQKYPRGPVSRKLSIMWFCDGAIIALVAITPAAGYVPVWSSPIFGLVSCIFVNFLKRPARVVLRDDILDVFPIHAGGGWIGMLLTGCFAEQSVVGLDGYSTIPDRSIAERLRYQMLDAFAGLLYTFFVTMAILYGLKILRSIFRCRWEPVFDSKRPVQDKIEATVQYMWRPKDGNIV